MPPYGEIFYDKVSWVWGNFWQLKPFQKQWKNILFHVKIFKYLNLYPDFLVM